MTNNIYSFIERYKDHINDNEWTEIYYVLAHANLSREEVGIFTSMMLECDINPLLYMYSVPYNYLNSYKGSKFLKIDIPDNIETISANAFKDSYHLEYINIPKSVKNIEVDSLPKNNIPIYIPYNSLIEFQENVNLLNIDIYSNDYLFISSSTGDILTTTDIKYNNGSIYNPNFYSLNDCSKTLREEIEEYPREWELKNSFDNSIFNRWKLYEIATLTDNKCLSTFEDDDEN